MSGISLPVLVFASRNDLLVRTRDGRNCALCEPLLFALDDGRRFRVPVGASTDGFSTPPGLWPVLPPFGAGWLAAIVHDAGYRNTLEVWNGKDWVPACLSKDECDSLLMAGMITLCVEEDKRNLIYTGVHVGGWKAFREDRNG